MRWLALLLMLLIPTGVAAQGKHCGPGADKNLVPNTLFYKLPDYTTYKPLHHILTSPTQATDIEFLYVVIPRRGYELTIGAAFSIKTYRFHDIPPSTSDVLLYRNEFPSYARLRDARISEYYYEVFHSRGLSFRNPLGVFHASYTSLDGTVETNRLPRRRAFRFTHQSDWPQPALKRSMLMHVGELNPSGTCIPFMVQVDEDVRKLVVEITALDSPEVGHDAPIYREIRFE